MLTIPVVLTCRCRRSARLRARHLDHLLDPDPDGVAVHHARSNFRLPDCAADRPCCGLALNLASARLILARPKHRRRRPRDRAFGNFVMAAFRGRRDRVHDPGDREPSSSPGLGPHRGSRPANLDAMPGKSGDRRRPLRRTDDERRAQAPKHLEDESSNYGAMDALEAVRGDAIAGLWCVHHRHRRHDHRYPAAGRVSPRPRRPSVPPGDGLVTQIPALVSPRRRPAGLEGGFEAADKRCAAVGAIRTRSACREA